VHADIGVSTVVLGQLKRTSWSTQRSSASGEPAVPRRGARKVTDLRVEDVGGGADGRSVEDAPAATEAPRSSSYWPTARTHPASSPGCAEAGATTSVASQRASPYVVTERVARRHTHPFRLSRLRRQPTPRFRLPRRDVDSSVPMKVQVVGSGRRETALAMAAPDKSRIEERVTDLHRSRPSNRRRRPAPT